ncbi:hypothetical protein CCHR01_19744 [Colletotrichum chrysophilum]|uniref:Uncharacterized protein n=1 Tax=Colletotrichum chrysophilum TaxID=1836956 RepID=A0AAD9E7K5_9PEZI|nr:hypothetical protein K456DRAFT_58634 [Colletotrichum gloeosporioides 23]KAK1837632.1 hypothetical protein CCHR01_19744 [Colletotrichum chrysophilum]
MKGGMLFSGLNGTSPTAAAFLVEQPHEKRYASTAYTMPRLIALWAWLAWAERGRRASCRGITSTTMGEGDGEQ